MKAVVVSKPGPAENMSIGTAERPALSADSILVRVKATAVNRADVLQRMGLYPPPPGESSIIGLECTGVVEEVGSSAGSWAVGDRVCALLGGGGYAELCAVPSGQAMRVLDGMDFVQAAAIPEAFLTAYQCLTLGGLDLRASKPEERRTVLIHAGASGVGTAAIQLASVGGMHRVFATTSEKKTSVCTGLGAEAAIARESGPWLPELMRLTEGRGADVVLDFVGAPYWQQNIDCLALDGTLVIIGFLGSSKLTENFDLAPILRKRLQIKGTTLRSRDPAYKANLVSQFSDFALPLFAAGKLRPIVHSVLPIEEVQKAHQLMERNENVGKLVLTF